MSNNLALETVPKIRSFLWRAASGALAVAERLTTRELTLDTQCKICLSGSESISHVLFSCSKAQEAWSLAGFQDLSHLHTLPLTESLSSCLQMMNDPSVPLAQRRAIPWFFWSIWKNKNSLLTLILKNHSRIRYSRREKKHVCGMFLMRIKWHNNHFIG